MISRNMYYFFYLISQEEYLNESKGCLDKVKASLRNHTDILIGCFNDILDEETKQLEEYKKAEEILNESKLFFENDN